MMHNKQTDQNPWVLELDFKEIPQNLILTTIRSRGKLLIKQYEAEKVYNRLLNHMIDGLKTAIGKNQTE